MKKLSLLVVGLLCLSVVIYAGEVITNNTGEDATGLRVSFSTPVLITAFGDILTSVDPQMLSSEFIFSGGIVEPWGSHWMSRAPATASIIEYEWLTQPSSIRTTSSEASRIAYSYLTEPCLCHSSEQATVPVYLSVSPSTPSTDVFTVNVQGANDVVLTKVDEILHIGEVTVDRIPVSLDVRVQRNGTQIGDWESLYIENGFQTITLALPEIQDIEDNAPFSADFLRGATLTDIWGYYLFGTPGEARIHVRDYFGSTCDRLVEDGCRDVFVTTFLEYVSLLPEPTISPIKSSGAGSISEADLQTLASTAHERGLQLHIRYDLYSVSDKISLDYLNQPKKPGWIEAFFQQYGAALLPEIAKAERSGVDAIVVGMGMDYAGYEAVWAAQWQSLLAKIRSTFRGRIEYYLRTPDRDNYASHRLPEDMFSDVDAFLWSMWSLGLSSTNDSYSTLMVALRGWLRQFEAFANLNDKPLYVDIGVQSTDGFIANGWYDVSIGKLGNTTPDFFEQSRTYEALFEVLAASDIFDGVILYKYHWDDPFGPDLPEPALARMDLSASVRNKPAEAVMKRWFGGRAGPAVQISDQENLAMRRPWCELYVVDEHNDGINTPSVLIVDDFEGSSDLPDAGGSWGFSYSSKNRTKDNPDSFCEISHSTSAGSASSLKIDFLYVDWMHIALTTRIDASAYDGIEVSLSSEIPMRIEIDLGIVEDSPIPIRYRFQGIRTAESVTRFRIPFADFALEPSMESLGVSSQHLGMIRWIGFYMYCPGVSNTFTIDDLVLYKAAD